MPRYQLTPPPKGTRLPGAGRKKGTPNKISVEVRRLVSDLMTDADYQRRLRADFRQRRVHPTIEALIWTYHLGKPKQQIELSGSVDVTARMEAERAAFASLDLADLEQLAAESQALVDRAMALSKIRQTPQDVVVAGYLPEVSGESLGNRAGSDNPDYVVHSAEPEECAPTHEDATGSGDLPEQGDDPDVTT